MRKKAISIVTTLIFLALFNSYSSAQVSVVRGQEKES
jgi:hypothetical protein